jgi:hypothetical protein
MDDSERVIKHIRVCDKMYESVWGKPDDCPETSVCKRLIALGMGLSGDDLPRVCIRECERWNLRALGW